MLNCTARTPNERQTTATTPTTSRSLPWPTAIFALPRSGGGPERLDRLWGSGMTFAFRLPRPPVVALVAALVAPLEVPPEAPCRFLRSRASFVDLFLLSPAIYYVLPVAPIVGLEIFAARISHLEISAGQSADPPRFRKLCESYLEPFSLVLGSDLLLLEPGRFSVESGRHAVHVDASQHQEHRHHHQNNEDPPLPHPTSPVLFRCSLRHSLWNASRNVPTPNGPL